MQLEFWEDENKTAAPRASSARRGSSRVIRASEIGEYIYCHRAWWLGRVQGVPNANRAALDAGIVRHRAHGQTVQRSDQLQRVAIILAAGAIIAGVVLAARWLGWMF